MTHIATATLRAAWDAAIDAWQQARCAEWTPTKVTLVAEAAERCSAARRAYYASL